MMTATLIHDLLLILAAGLIAAILCRRIGVSVLVGYLIAGAILGGGTLAWIANDNHQLEHFAEVGVFFLLFSIGLEFSPDDLRQLGIRQIYGGIIQMGLTAAPVAVVLWLLAWHPVAITLVAAAVSFSSTVLVFKALSERGENELPVGRRAIGLLLFQDAALVPLLLIVPLIAGVRADPDAGGIGLDAILKLILISTGFVISVFAARWLLANYVIHWLTNYRSTDLVILFTLVVLGGVTLAASSVGLPPAVGAFAAGLIFNGNRWAGQIDALVLPFRETFSAIFFVGLGLLFAPGTIVANPVAMAISLIGLIAIKWIAAALALRVTGVDWRRAIGTGLGLAHIGEFAFVLLLLGVETGTIADVNYARVVTLAIGSLILTPMLLRTGLRWAGEHHETNATDFEEALHPHRAAVIGMGPIGRQVASQLETMGREVTLIDSSPLNLHAFAAEGFHTAVGDATDPSVLRAAEIELFDIAIVCVPDDTAAIDIVNAIRRINRRCRITVRCRYQSHIAAIQKAGATQVVSEEAEVSTVLVRLLRTQ